MHYFILTNHIRRLRFEANEMTQLQLAQSVGVSRQAIVAIEGMKYSPSLELAFKIAGVFGKPIGEVFQYGTNDSFHHKPSPEEPSISAS